MRAIADLVEYVRTRTDVRGRCWHWRGTTNEHGYGRIRGETERREYVHRMVYEWTYGPLVEGQVVMHACDTPACVNPAHLSAGTQTENVADMRSKGRGRSASVNHLKTECPRGHLYDAANTYTDAHGWRRCRTCHRDRMAGRTTTEAAA